MTLFPQPMEEYREIANQDLGDLFTSEQLHALLDAYEREQIAARCPGTAPWDALVVRQHGDYRDAADARERFFATASRVELTDGFRRFYEEEYRDLMMAAIGLANAHRWSYGGPDSLRALAAALRARG